MRLQYVVNGIFMYLFQPCGSGVVWDGISQLPPIPLWNGTIYCGVSDVSDLSVEDGDEFAPRLRSG